MSEDLNKEILLIQEQAQSMLETIRSIRGEDYENLVRMMINVQHMILFFRLTLEHSNLKQETQDALDKNFMHSFEAALSSVYAISGIDKQGMIEVVIDAKNIDDASTRLLKTALFKKAT